MKSDAVRISIDLPRDLHRRVRKVAAGKGCTARELILAGIERVVEETEMARSRQRLSLDPPLIRPAGRRIRVTDEELYRLIE
jgi:hypothetical protein